jgi:hypothetical protein
MCTWSTLYPNTSVQRGMSHVARPDIHLHRVSVVYATVDMQRLTVGVWATRHNYKSDKETLESERYASHQDTLDVHESHYCEQGLA